LHVQHTYVIYKDYSIGGGILLISLPDNKNTLSDIALKLSFMSITNVEWSCLYSGAGIVHSSGEKLNRGNKDLPVNISYLKCLYKKSKPVFLKTPDHSNTDEDLSWDDKSFSRVITPASQAMAILSMCTSAELVYPTDPKLAASLAKNATYCMDFTSGFMRNMDGLFIAVEDKTKILDEELKLKPCSKNAKLSDQVLMHEAAACLHNITCQESMKELLSPRTEEYKQEAENILSFTHENLPQVLSSSSKELSICISSFYRCLCLENYSVHIDEIKELISILCAELETRIRITGEVESGPDSLNTSSIMTHVRVSSAMLEGYEISGILKFKELGIRVYNYLEDLYNPDVKLYIEGNPSKTTCSIRDIADIMKLQLMKYRLDTDPKAEKRLTDMYSILIEKSGIMQSSPDRKLNIGGQIIGFPEHIPNAMSTGRAPVFVKSIKFNLKKDTGAKASKHFNSLYALYASYTFLHYFLGQYKTQTYTAGAS